MKLHKSKETHKADISNSPSSEFETAGMLLQTDKAISHFANIEKATLQAQVEVTEYNSNIGKIHAGFQEKNLIGHRIVVRLFKYDMINPPVSSTLAVTTRKDMKLRVPNHSRTGFVSIDNPLPYMYKGVICQVPDTEAFKTNFPLVQVGAVVELDNFPISQKVYYPNKRWEDARNITDEDLLNGMNPAENFQGYVLLSPSDVTHVYKDKVEITYEIPMEEKLAEQALTEMEKNFKQDTN